MKASFRLALLFLFAIIAPEIKSQDNYYVCKSVTDLFLNDNIRNNTYCGLICFKTILALRLNIDELSKCLCGQQGQTLEKNLVSVYTNYILPPCTLTFPKRWNCLWARNDHINEQKSENTAPRQLIDELRWDYVYLYSTDYLLRFRSTV